MTKKILIIVLAVVIVLGLYAWSAYNSFVSKNTTVDKQGAQVQTTYQSRFDLIPNLVASVQGTMKQVQAIFFAIADARTKYGSAVTVDEKSVAASQVETALGRLLVVMENYPELKSGENIQQLMVQLEGQENRVRVERQRFNADVQVLNVAVKSFPSNVMAGIFGFKARPYFEAAAGAENAPVVKF